MSSQRAHCVTIFDLTWGARFKYELVSDSCRYLIVGLEICPGTGRYHYQCYDEWGKLTGYKGVKEILGDPSLHVETRKGTREQARDYCKKDGNWAEYGNWDAGGQGQRNDITHLKEAIKSGMSLTNLYLDFDVMWRVDRSAKNFKLL